MTPLSSRGDDHLRHPSFNACATSSFAHPSEQLFATLLNLYGIEWRYEPEVELLVVYQRDFVELLKQHDLGTLGDFAA